MIHSVTEEMKLAGNAMAADLMSATIAKSFSENWAEFIAEYRGKNIDLIEAYVAEELDSVTAIYLAMEREKK